MEKSEEVSARMTTTTPKEYTNGSPNGDPNWGFIDYCQGVVECWARPRSGYLAVAMQEWALRHPDRFASVKAMTTVSEGCIFILYAPPEEARLAEKVSPGLIRGLQQCFMQASSKEASAAKPKDTSSTKPEEALATDAMAVEHKEDKEAPLTDTMSVEHDV